MGRVDRSERDPLEGLRQLAEDRRSGASEIFQRALDLLIDSARLGLPKESVLEEVKTLSASHPEMVPLLNLAFVMKSLSGWPAGAAGRLGALREHVRSARFRAAEVAAEQMKGVRRVVTLSWSSTAFEALRRAALSGSLREVVVSQSLPLGEGLQTARRLASLPVIVRVIPDSAIPSHVGEADAGLVGADAVLGDGSLVNKVGTLSMALACDAFEVPLVVTTDLLKVDVRGRFRRPETSSCEGLPEPPEGVELACPVFEVVPARYVSTYATEGGPIQPSEVVNRARRLIRSLVGG
ncbi:MAG: hypothetical protein QI223_02835 [Candidatus Korarchaeota archaeon]|nr:hypothetical protein [Candidatus Korarchaeota archaeon]